MMEFLSFVNCERSFDMASHSSSLAVFDSSIELLIASKVSDAICLPGPFINTGSCTDNSVTLKPASLQS